MPSMRATHSKRGGRRPLPESRADRRTTYRDSKAAFERRRRKLRLGFDALHRLFAADHSFDRIAAKAGVSKTRVRHIFGQYFRQAFRVDALERRLAREAERRRQAVDRIVRAFRRDPVMRAVAASASRHGRTVGPVIHKMERNVSRCFRHRAVLVDGVDVESVHHIRTARKPRADGVSYGTTTLTRACLEQSTWIVFYIDVPHRRRRVIRCRSRKLLRAVFSGAGTRRDVYIPVHGVPGKPRYDFLADEDNWAR